MIEKKINSVLKIALDLLKTINFNLKKSPLESFKTLHQFNIKKRPIQKPNPHKLVIKAPHYYFFVIFAFLLALVKP